VLDEQQVVGPGRIPVDPERERARLLLRALRRELRHDRLRFGLLAGLELDRENLGEHRVNLLVDVTREASAGTTAEVWPDSDNQVVGRVVRHRGLARVRDPVRIRLVRGAAMTYT
jgi:hypothetical protein